MKGFICKWVNLYCKMHFLCFSVHLTPLLLSHHSEHFYREPQETLPSTSAPSPSSPTPLPQVLFRHPVATVYSQQEMIK